MMNKLLSSLIAAGAAACLLSATAASQERPRFQMPKLNAKVIPAGEITPETGLVRHLWTGKTVLFIGDSISDCILARHDFKMYYEHLADWLGITPVVTAISGMEWNAVPMQLNLYKEAMGEQVPDAICILLGTNDYNMGLPLGQWYREVVKDVRWGSGADSAVTSPRTCREIDYTDDTFRGRINEAMKLLKDTYPGTPIVLLTPPHRGYFYFADNNEQPDELVQNRIGLYLDSYVEAIKEAANVWSVSVVDLNAEANLFPLLDSQAAFYTNLETDRLHPAGDGHLRMAKVLLQRTFLIPCR